MTDLDALAVLEALEEESFSLIFEIGEESISVETLGNEYLYSVVERALALSKAANQSAEGWELRHHTNGAIIADQLDSVSSYGFARGTKLILSLRDNPLPLLPPFLEDLEETTVTAEVRPDPVIDRYVAIVEKDPLERQKIEYSRDRIPVEMWGLPQAGQIVAERLWLTRRVKTVIEDEHI